MKTLLVGFKKYATHKVNPSEDVLALIDSKDIRKVILDVSYQKAKGILEIIEEEKPDFIITLNLSPFRKVPAIEEYAYNEMNSVQPDEDGVTKLGEEIIPGGSKSLNCSLDIPTIRQYVSTQGQSLSVSIDPGRFVCNEVSYLVRSTNIPSVSLHIPLAKDFPLDEEKEIIEILIDYYKATH